MQPLTAPCAGAHLLAMRSQLDQLFSVVISGVGQYECVVYATAYASVACAATGTLLLFHCSLQQTHKLKVLPRHWEGECVWTRVASFVSTGWRV